MVCSLLTSMKSGDISTLLMLLGVMGACCGLNCTSDYDCSEYEDNRANMTVGVCNVATGTCSCSSALPSGCFEVDESSNMCALTACGNFFNRTNEICRVGSFSKTTALLLSIFLINFGAANFYIEQYALAIPQIILGLLLCVFQFGGCAAAAARDDHEKITKTCTLCCSLNLFFTLTVVIWWLVDLIIFAVNARNDGNGCPLY